MIELEEWPSEDDEPSNPKKKRKPVPLPFARLLG